MNSIGKAILTACVLIAGASVIALMILMPPTPRMIENRREDTFRQVRAFIPSNAENLRPMGESTWYLFDAKIGNDTKTFMIRYWSPDQQSTVITQVN